MSKAAKTIVGFAIYMTLTGIPLVVAPNLLLGLLRIQPTQEPWIRLLGMFMIIVSYYYYRAARSEATEFFRATVHGRATIGVFMIGLGWSTGIWMLALFALGEWFGAALTWLALASSREGGR